MIASYCRRHVKCFIWAGSMAAAALLFIWLSRSGAGFAQWYAVWVFPIFPNTIGRILSPLPFSVYEFALYALSLGFLCFLGTVLFFAFYRRSGLGKLLSRFFRFLLCGASAVFLMLTLTCLINYGRIPFGETAGYSLCDSSVSELAALCEELAAQANEFAAQIPTEPSGCLSLEGVNIRKQAKQAMAKLGEQYPSLSGYYPNPKPVAFSWGMSHLRLTGMFSPFTIEANYNRNIPDYEIPYTVCHELAHLKGWIREDEAGFIAYLACRGSDDPALRYSGTLNALSYAMNALYGAGWQDSYWRIYESLPEKAKADYRFSNAYWKQFETKVAEVSTSLNDGYLKANAQTDGVQSYGRMVDLLLAERRSR
ncbi:MAG: DUF3810 domain-containing protein [Oscillospiraceae bacterium]|nr:DUF3810 domain-containing protein [Oscillospiraceae bacterium]